MHLFHHNNEKKYVEDIMELLDTRQILAFKTIVDTGGFTRAARQLNLTQSALSHQIKSLETQLETPVFARLGKRVVLTQAGEVLLRYVVPVLQQLRDAQQAITALQEPGHGRLRVSAASYSCYLILPHVLREFRALYKHIELFVTAEYTDKAAQGLLSGELDLGIFVLPSHTEGLEVEPLCQDELVVIVAPEHAWARRRHVQWADLATQVLITYFRASETFHLIQGELHRRGVNVRETMEVRHGAAVVEMVKVGLGVALIPRWVVRDEIQDGTLHALVLGRGGLKRRWVIARAKGAPLTPYSSAFMHMCHKWFAELMQKNTSLAASKA